MKQGPAIRLRKDFEPRQHVDPVDADFFRNLSEADKQLVPSFLETVLASDPESVAKLKNSIAENNGALRMFVHPLYPIERSEDMSEVAKTSAEVIEKGFERHIQSSSKVPMIVLEEDGAKVETLRARGLFVIPTQEGDTSLAGDVMLDAAFNFSFIRPYLGSGLSGDDIAFQMHLVTDELLLTGLGVRRLILGGMYIHDAQTSSTGCVTLIVRSAKRLGIPVILSRYHMDENGLNVDGEPFKKPARFEQQP